ncbi:PP2C family serine/threonine-protein phosphatase [Thiocystis violacea]|uniref:PP2C family serine/threonine-protein phosphatase n=1 Tax=Thiocystis violacea TaxID=13725 RepID=UPI00190613D2|nr:PP2C family serine/threonine-protein phosphatase [Thiocystis violacea]MBK1716415.1 hypothetical protein [Thiocystis violacea]
MSDSPEKPRPQAREVFAPNIENLVQGLFGRGAYPFFDTSGVTPEALSEFVQREEVFEAAFQFATTLMTLWRAGHPETPLRPLPPPSRGGSSDSQSTPSQPRTQPAGLRPGQVPAAASPRPQALEPRASFRLPNGKVGVPYVERIAGGESDGGVFRILDARVPAGLGLTFDPASGELSGTPILDGEHRIALRWTLDGKGPYSGDGALIVNPDPRSLWKVVEPPADAPYRKPHADGRWLSGQGFRLAAASRRGRSHEHAGSFRDDDFLIHADPSSGWSLILVADGAGSAPWSREGSRLAVSVAGEHLRTRLAGDLGTSMAAALARWDADPSATRQTMGEAFGELFRQASLLAVEAIEREALAQGAAFRDYATTLLAAAVRRAGRETFLATFWMGDGAIAAYEPGGGVRLMGTPDSGEFAGQTRFLDRAALSAGDFAKRIGIGRYSDPTVVLLMTDGVSDPYFETDNGLRDPARWDRLWEEIAPRLDASEPDQRLIDWLGFFSPGHHDDRTLALLW